MSYPAEMFRWPPAEILAAEMVLAHYRPTQAARCYQAGTPPVQYRPLVLKVLPNMPLRTSVVGVG